MCTEKNIKELLPAYEEQMLGQTEKERVEEHLAACEDCRSEASLLRVMAADVVPDPGEAFWATMPDRVYRAVQDQKMKGRRFSLSWFTDRFTMPRWVVAAATVGVAVISLLTFHALRQEPGMPVSSGYELPDEVMSANSPLSVAELSQDQIDAITAWTGSELASISQQAAPVVPVVLGNVHASDIDEELAELNAGEIEKLAKMIEQWNKEG